jgi:hypothetical protein
MAMTRHMTAYSKRTMTMITFSLRSMWDAL